jgi:hypothetical protein
MEFIRKSSLFALTCCLGLLVVFSANCAENNKDAGASKSDAASCFDKINTWAEGVVSNVDANSGKFTVKGVKLPFASAHAELRSEYAKRVASATPAKKQEIAEELSKKWQDKLEKAKTEKESDTLSDFNLKAPSSGDMVFLIRRSAQDMAFVTAEEDASGAPKLSGELVSIDVYEVPKAASGEAQPVGSNPTLKDLKSGDRIKVGFDSSTNEACAIVRIHDGEGGEHKEVR